ncbi:hypothetical protein UFOVP841_12 [uncultured Caudovirales phage]|uniref:Uncharacterized protein n=1 Tax=uncultured Caudovirales phage TaxID=2100421 RepID=A0A6J5P7C7_9CAUD|nr:hypothetical protein UFOVP841_12 [uncultured Caudovirales phage]
MHRLEYTWQAATGQDVPSIVRMAQQHFESEIDSIFTPDPIAYSRNITVAVVQQFYAPLTQLVSVAKTQQNQLIAYTWAQRNERAAWSDNEMVVVKMAHMDMSLSARTRVGLVTDMINLWEQWALLCQVPIVCSTTMRGDQAAFLKIHQRAGYDVRGSFCYKRI